MSSIPTMPTTPNAVAMAEGSGASTNDHTAKKAHSSVHTVMKIIVEATE